MNVKSAVYFVLTGIIVIMMGCGSGSKYSDFVEVNTKFLGAMEAYITAMGEADSAKEVAKAINEYSDELEKIVPQIKKVMDKYPELQNTTEVPEELKSIERRSKDLEQKVANSYKNMMKYMMDPEVQAAQQRLQKAMLGLR